VLATRNEENATARSRELAGPAAGLGPSGEATRAHGRQAGHRQRKNGPRAGGATRAAEKDWAAGPKAREGSETLFSFSFSNISKHFQLILNSILNLNQTTPTKNSNATT
jgi:hypothetical protein